VVVLLLGVLVVVCALVLDEVVVTDCVVEVELGVEVELEVEEDELEGGGDEPAGVAGAKPNWGPLASKTP
jgi:hypothetical protein